MQNQPKRLYQSLQRLDILKIGCTIQARCEPVDLLDLADSLNLETVIEAGWSRKN